MATDPLLNTFLPPGVAAPAAPKGVRADREADPKVGAARKLCDYGYKILDDTYKDYQLQIGRWQTQFGEIIAALVIASEKLDETLAGAAKERERDAAESAFFTNLIFSMLTLGAMAFLGEFVKATLPNVKFGRGVAIQKDPFEGIAGFETSAYLARSVYDVETIVVKTPIEFTKLQTSIFGTILKDSGNRLIPLAFPSPPAPRAMPLSLTTKGGIESLRADFNKMVIDSAAVTLGQFKKVQQWMNQEPEFGAAWLAATNGNAEDARNLALHHVETLRGDWAKQWEFFGKSPVQISRKMLAEQYERAWWASYVVETLTIFPYGKMTTPEDSGWGSIFPLGRGRRKIIELAIVARLRELNIVYAETIGGINQQISEKMQRDGAPRPEVGIDGAVDWDDQDEATALYKWAKGFLQRAPKDTPRQFFPAGQVRTLDPLRAAYY